MTSKRLYRSTEDRMFAGVCGGIAAYMDVDPTLVRLFFVALTLMGGPGFIIYIVLMLIVPEETDEKTKAKRTLAEDAEIPAAEELATDEAEMPVRKKRASDDAA